MLYKQLKNLAYTQTLQIQKKQKIDQKSSVFCKTLKNDLECGCLICLLKNKEIIVLH